MIGPNLASPRDVREFVESKRVKREPLKWNARGVAAAAMIPSGRSNFEALRGELRRNRYFARASERLDALEFGLKHRDASLPVPERVFQNTDQSLGLSFGGLTVLCHPDGVAYLLGGTSGQLRHGITRELIEALALKWRSSGRNCSR